MVNWNTSCIIISYGETSLLMWLGEQITSKGIGNGISIIIFIGIISGLPSGITTYLENDIHKHRI